MAEKSPSTGNIITDVYERTRRLVAWLFKII